MYPPKFDYFRATSIDEAMTLKAQHPDGKFLAGGHSLIPVMKLRLANPGVLIDIGRIPQMKGIAVDNGIIKIGALTTHSMVEDAEGLPTALSEAAGYIGDRSVRNRGTVGGNIAHADPASDLPTVFVALNAVMRVRGADGVRSVAAGDFFTDLFETDLGDNDLLIGVGMPVEQAGTGSAYVKLFNPASRYAMVGVAVQISMDGNTCTSATVAVGGMTPAAQRLPSVEAALIGNTIDDAAIQAAAAAAAGDVDGDTVLSDIHASAEYRMGVAPALVARAITKAVDRAS